MIRPSNEPRAIRQARALANIRRTQAADRDNLITEAAALMITQAEAHLEREARR